MPFLDFVFLEGENSRNLGISNPDFHFPELMACPGQPAGAWDAGCSLRGRLQLSVPGGQGAEAGLSLCPPQGPGRPAGPRSVWPGLQSVEAHTKGCLDIAPITRAWHPTRGPKNKTPSTH